MKRVLVLRPEPGASATVERAREQGLDAFAVPLFEIESLPWAVPDPADIDALLLTSANAVRYGGEGLRMLINLPAYAVGEGTAEAARKAGFEIAGIGSAGVDRLLSAIPSHLKLLHLCGEDRREPLAPRQEIASIPVYRATEIPDPDLRGLGACVALIHSPRAGRHFAELIPDHSGIAIAAISPAAAEAVGTGWELVETAGEPSDDALLALAARLCNKPASK
jgi:uroporphyrinogen-III synthase